MVPENLGQLAPSAKEPRFHSARGDSEDLRSLIDSQALQIDQDDGTAELFGDLVKGGVDVGSDFGGLEWIARLGIRGVEPFREGIGAAAFRAAQVVVTRVHRHPVQPGAERRLSPVLVGLAEHCEERLLGRVEGGFAVAQHPQTDAKDPVLMGAHEFVEGVQIPLEVPPDEVNIFSCAMGHVS